MSCHFSFCAGHSRDEINRNAYQRDIFVFLVEDLQDHWDPFAAGGVVVKLVVVVAVAITAH